MLGLQGCEATTVLCSAGDETQGCLYARKAAHHHLNYILNPDVCFISSREIPLGSHEILGVPVTPGQWTVLEWVE